MTNLAKITDQAPAEFVADPMVAMIERVAMSPDVPVDRLSALMDMRERQMAKEAEQHFNRAFAAAMAEMPNVPRTGKNKHLGNSYSTLDDLIKTVRPVLSRHGLSLNWQTSIDGATINVTATVRHEDGHTISTTLSGPRDTGKQMNTLQGGGSTETYLKRYSGFGILGLSSGDETDDDGRNLIGSDTISADQWNDLAGLIEKAGVAESLILTAYNIGSLEEMPATTFESAKRRLLKTIEQKGAK